MTIRRRLALFAALCLTLALAVPPARAAAARTGSIRVAAEAVTLRRVGDASGVLCPEYAGSGADPAKWASPETARCLADYARKHDIPGDARTADGSGYVTFDGLEPGLYLVEQPGSPFLVPLPLTVGQQVYHDIIASPKPAEDPPPTGQLLGVGHWLAVSAGALLALAAVRKKK